MTKTQRWVRHLAWEPQKKRHLQFITQGRALVSRVTTPLPCNQSIDQWINEHDNAQSDLLARPSFKKLRRYSDLHGGEKRMDCRNQTRSRKVFQTKIRQQKKKLCNNTERTQRTVYCKGAHTSQIVLLSSAIGRLSTYNPSSSCSYRRLAAPNEMFLVIMSLLIWKWRQQLTEVKHFPWIQEVIYLSLSCFKRPLAGCRKQFIQCFQFNK